MVQSQPVHQGRDKGAVLLEAGQFRGRGHPCLGQGCAQPAQHRDCKDLPDDGCRGAEEALQKDGYKSQSGRPVVLCWQLVWQLFAV